MTITLSYFIKQRKSNSRFVFKAYDIFPEFNKLSISEQKSLNKQIGLLNAKLILYFNYYNKTKESFAESEKARSKSLINKSCDLFVTALVPNTAIQAQQERKKAAFAYLSDTKELLQAELDILSKQCNKRREFLKIKQNFEYLYKLSYFSEHPSRLTISILLSSLNINDDFILKYIEKTPGEQQEMLTYRLETILNNIVDKSNHLFYLSQDLKQKNKDNATILANLIITAINSDNISDKIDQINTNILQATLKCLQDIKNNFAEAIIITARSHGNADVNNTTGLIFDQSTYILKNNIESLIEKFNKSLLEIKKLLNELNIAVRLTELLNIIKSAVSTSSIYKYLLIFLAVKFIITLIDVILSPTTILLSPVIILSTYLLLKNLDNELSNNLSNILELSFNIISTKTNLLYKHYFCNFYVSNNMRDLFNNDKKAENIMKFYKSQIEKTEAKITKLKAIVAHKKTDEESGQNEQARETYNNHLDRLNKKLARLKNNWIAIRENIAKTPEDKEKIIRAIESDIKAIIYESSKKALRDLYRQQDNAQSGDNIVREKVQQGVSTIIDFINSCSQQIYITDNIFISNSKHIYTGRIPDIICDIKESNLWQFLVLLYDNIRVTIVSDTSQHETQKSKHNSNFLARARILATINSITRYKTTSIIERDLRICTLFKLIENIRNGDEITDKELELALSRKTVSTEQTQAPIAPIIRVRRTAQHALSSISPTEELDSTTGALVIATP